MSCKGQPEAEHCATPVPAHPTTPSSPPDTSRTISLPTSGAWHCSAEADTTLITMSAMLLLSYWRKDACCCCCCLGFYKCLLVTGGLFTKAGRSQQPHVLKSTLSHRCAVTRGLFLSRFGFYRTTQDTEIKTKMCLWCCTHTSVQACSIRWPAL